jgi:hypothetical protein
LGQFVAVHARHHDVGNHEVQKLESWTVKFVLYCSCAAMSFMLQCRNSVTVSSRYSP